MHESGSFLQTILDRVRALVDEPSTKYNDQYLVNHVIMPEMTNVLSRLENNNDAIILNEITYTPAVDTQFITLPPNVGEVHRLNVMDANGRVIRDFSPRETWNRGGPGWAIEGNTLRFRPIVGAGAGPTAGETITLWYKAEGDFMPHHATDGTLVETANEVKRLRLSSSPTYGQVDRRANAYVGAYLRILPATGVIEERIISAHHPEASQPYVEVRTPFEHARETLPEGSSSFWQGSSSSETYSGITYEIAPVGSQALYQAVAALSAVALAETKDLTQRKMKWLQSNYLRALKTAGDRLATMNMRKPKHYKRNTVDNPESRIWFLQ